MAGVIRELEACRGSGEELQETASISYGPTGGDPTITHERAIPEMTVAPAPLPKLDSGNSRDGNWLDEELPESPTILRSATSPVRRPRKKWLTQQQCIVYGSIAAALPLRIGKSLFWWPKELQQWIEAGCPKRNVWQARRT